jgi:energy-converting hydrogenase Eha subunit H
MLASEFINNTPGTTINDIVGYLVLMAVITFVLCVIAVFVVIMAREDGSQEEPQEQLRDVLRRRADF